MATRPATRLPWVVLTIAVTVAGCGGGGNGPAVSNTPVIANARVAFGTPCTLPNGRAATNRTVTVDFADGNGDLAGGRAVSTGVGNVTGSTVTLIFQIPGPGVIVNGTTNGTIVLFFCNAFGVDSSVTESLQLFDGASNASNILTIVFTRPAGAPETIRQGFSQELVSQ